MRNRHTCLTSWLGTLLIISTLAGCTSAIPSGTSGFRSIESDAMITDLTPDIETLYLTCRRLDQIYKDIKFLERGFLFDPDDRQLGYIQKTGLYLQDASLRAHHQWEQLSMLHYIRPEMMRDYVTLSVNGLTSAIDEIGYDDRFIEIYAAFITHEAVSDDLDRAQDQMRIVAGVLNDIRQKLLPLANATEPPRII